MLWEHEMVKVEAARKGKSEAELLDQATRQLLRAVKQRLRNKQGRVDYAKLRKDGYSERFLARLEGTLTPGASCGANGGSRT
jgi:hypothetical protein